MKVHYKIPIYCLHKTDKIITKLLENNLIRITDCYWFIIIFIHFLLNVVPKHSIERNET